MTSLSGLQELKSASRVITKITKTYEGKRL